MKFRNRLSATTLHAELHYRNCFSIQPRHGARTVPSKLTTASFDVPAINNITSQATNNQTSQQLAPVVVTKAKQTDWDPSRRGFEGTSEEVLEGGTPSGGACFGD